MINISFLWPGMWEGIIRQVEGAETCWYFDITAHLFTLSYLVRRI